MEECQKDSLVSMGLQFSTIIHLGSNLGDRERNLSDGIRALATFGELTASSSIFETEPWGNEEQPRFLNQAVELLTELDPVKLLQSLNFTEEQLGRVRHEKWGPRTLDLDIIFYGDKIVDLPELSIPHPELHKRAFVLLPLLEICPDRIHPVLDMPVWELYDLCTDLTEVYLWDVSL